MIYRITLLSLILFVSLSFSSKSILRKSISRRQSDPQYCHAIEGFECKCSYYRVTCINNRDLPTPINILPNEKHKYQSVELVVAAERDIHVDDYTFEPVKQLYKHDASNLEFRIKFEKFTGLHLSSSGIFNQVFPDSLPSDSRKHIALEIYNPEIAPNENLHLFQNLNVDTLEVYSLYPFHGTFQQLFDGANIKYLRLSGGDIHSDVSQSFTGIIGRLELAKQASALSTINFPVYPAHELIINAFYITEFNAENPPNYSNLRELRVYSPDRIPANAFHQFSHITTLSISTEKDIDRDALQGLNNLEKLIIKDTKPSLDLLNSIPNLKEFETNIEKLDAETQCQLIEKLANGKIVVQPIPNGRECTCITAYLNTAVGRLSCDAQDCDRSSCSAIKNNYDASTRTFKTPPQIQRSDGTDALRPREPRTYASPFQIPAQDQDKFHRATEKHIQHPQTDEDSQRPTKTEHDHRESEQPDSKDGQDQDDSHHDFIDNSVTTNKNDQQPGEDDTDHLDKEDREYQDNGEISQTSSHDLNVDIEGSAINGTETVSPEKKGMSWLPIIIIAVAIIAVLLIGLIFLFLRKRRADKGYIPTATSEQGATGTTTVKS